MAATTGIWNPVSQAAATPFAGTRAMDSGSGDSNNTGSTISANDFLTLLVTEMQNQDPTATTDPNEYINQLVNVNSLEQLISINQTLQGAAGYGSGEAASQTTSATTQATVAHPSAAPGAQSAAASGAVKAPHRIATAPQSVANAVPITTVKGNFSAGKTSPSALRVAHALDAPHITR